MNIAPSIRAAEHQFSGGHCLELGSENEHLFNVVNHDILDFP